MRDRLTALMRRGTDGWKAFTPGQRAVTVFAVLALAIGGYFFATWAGQPTVAPLFSNLAASDASAIVDKLNADGVTYSLSDGGSTIVRAYEIADEHALAAAPVSSADLAKAYLSAVGWSMRTIEGALGR